MRRCSGVAACVQLKTSFFIPIYDFVQLIFIYKCSSLLVWCAHVFFLPLFHDTIIEHTFVPKTFNGISASEVTLEISSNISIWNGVNGVDCKIAAKKMQNANVALTR